MCLKSQIPQALITAQSENMRSKVFLVVRCFVPDIADECRVVELFCLHPKIFAGLIAFTFRIDDNRIDQLENVLFGMDVGKRVVVQTFCKVDGIQALHGISVPDQHFSAFDKNRTFGSSVFAINKMGLLNFFQIGRFGHYIFLHKPLDFVV